MKNANRPWKAMVATMLFALIAIVAVAVATGWWFLTALPVGFLFGFFLEKGSLCGAAAFSEALMFKDWQKIQGLAVAIGIGMAGFALLSSLDLIKLTPRHFDWLACLVAGLIFGAGMVLAGGCVSGALFKAGTGNLNSMAALAGIPLGVALVRHGPLKHFRDFLKQATIKSEDDGAITLSSLTGLPYWLLALLIAGTGLAVALWIRSRHRRENKPPAPESGPPLAARVFTRPWKPWQAGVAIGVLAGLAYLSATASGRNGGLCVTQGLFGAYLLVTDYPLQITNGPPAPASPAPTDDAKAKPEKKASLWLILETVALVLGAHVSARLTGRAKLLPKPPDETAIAFIGGVIAGVGAGIVGVCVVGGIMTGWALMSVASIIFGLATIAGNWVVTYFYLMGGKIG